jgi:hypothetical protein
MLSCYYFKVSYTKGAYVNVRFARSLRDAYAQECRDSITLPRALNAKYPHARQPTALNITALKAPSRQYLRLSDPRFLAYLDEVCRILDTPEVP